MGIHEGSQDLVARPDNYIVSPDGAFDCICRERGLEPLYLCIILILCLKETKMDKRKDKLIVALDVADIEACRDLVDSLYPTVKIFKIGSQLFTACGNEVINIIRLKGAKIFLDLKFHDIPSVAAKASSAAANLGIFMFNLHAAGGLGMMKRALESVEEVAQRLKIERPLMLGVTVLTSMTKKDLKDLGIRKDVESEVLFLAELAGKAGLDGVVASAEEIVPVKEKLGKDFLIVTPGIRPEWAGKTDQKRTATPKEAFDKGADYVVIGRPIIEAEDPKQAANRIIEELE